MSDEIKINKLLKGLHTKTFFKITIMTAVRKSFLLLLIFSFFTQFSAQRKGKDFSKIMQSTSIFEIDAYLRVAHPDDPKRLVLKPRLIEMIKEYIRTAHPADSRVAELQKKMAILRTKPSTRISYEEITESNRLKQIAKYQEKLDLERKANNNGVSQATQRDMFAGSTTLDAAEQEEFKVLMDLSEDDHKNKTVNILNSLFDNDPNSKESIVMIENKSDCNMILRIEGIGNANYKLAVASKSENSIVVPKGSYLFSGNVCGSLYAAQKTVQKAIMVSLTNP